MNENITNLNQNNNDTTAKNPPAPGGKKEKTPDPVEMYKKVKAGSLRLFEPFEVEDKVHEELNFDFGTLTGDEFVTAMDCDGAATRSITNNQCLTLFCQAAGSVNGLSPETVRENLRIVDAQEAVGRALNFLLISRAVARRTLKK